MGEDQMYEQNVPNQVSLQLIIPVQIHQGVLHVQMNHIHEPIQGQYQKIIFLCVTLEIGLYQGICHQSHVKKKL